MDDNSKIMTKIIKSKTFNIQKEKNSNNNEKSIEIFTEKSNNIPKSLINQNKVFNDNITIMNLKIKKELIDKNISNKEIQLKEDKSMGINDIKLLDKEKQNKNEILKTAENEYKSPKKEDLNISAIKDNDIINIIEKRDNIKNILSNNEKMNKTKIEQKNNEANSLIRQLRKEHINMVLKNISKKKRNRKKYRRGYHSVERGIHDGKKMRKLNKLHENDLSGISLGDSIILKEKDKFKIEDKEIINKIKLSQLEYIEKLKEEKKLKKKRKKKKSKSKKKKKKKHHNNNNENGEEFEQKENLNENYNGNNNNEGKPNKKKTKKKSKKKKKEKKIENEDNETISDLNDSTVNVKVIKKEENEDNDEDLFKNNINNKREKRKKRRKKNIGKKGKNYIEKIEESEESNYKNSTISKNDNENQNNKKILNEKEKKKIKLFKNDISKNTLNKKKYLKNGIIINETKDKKENKNEEKIVESKDLKSSIMTDNASNFFNTQGILQDNFSSTSYQTLQKILSKADPKPSFINSKNNISRLYKPSDMAYRTSYNFKSKMFNNNGSNYSFKRNNSKKGENNNINRKNYNLTPIYYKTSSKFATKTDFYYSKNKLINNSENQKFLSIEIEDINSNKNKNPNFNYSNNNFFNSKNFFSDENDNSLNKNNKQNKTLTVNKNKIMHKKIFKTPNNRNKNYMNDLINNPYNPYATNWPNSFLKKGFQLGFKYKTIHFGVPYLGIKKLNKKVILPPVYNIKYNQYSDNNNKDIKPKDNIVTYYNKDNTIKSLNLYLNVKEKSELELIEEYKKKIMKELNINANEEEESEDEDEEEEEDDEEEGEESEDDENEEQNGKDNSS